jgi:hypothetical protein
MSDTVTTMPFKGRDVAVHTPSATQVAAWQRVADRAGKLGLGEGELGEEEAAEFKTLLDRMFRIALSIFADAGDKVWFEEMCIDGEVTDQDLLDVFEKAMKRLSDDAPKVPAKKVAKRTRAASA